MRTLGFPEDLLRRNVTKVRGWGERRRRRRRGRKGVRGREREEGEGGREGGKEKRGR